MNNEPDWEKVKEGFEKDLNRKLKNLPGHREVAENLKGFRAMISHEIPETSSADLFEKLINILLGGLPISEDQIRKNYLEPGLENEKKILEKYKDIFIVLQKSSKKWVKENLLEEQLQTDWKEHRTWLPRRFTIYENPNLPFQEIAADTLARFYLIKHILK